MPGLLTTTSVLYYRINKAVRLPETVKRKRNYSFQTFWTVYALIVYLSWHRLYTEDASDKNLSTSGSSEMRTDEQASTYLRLR